MPNKIQLDLFLEEDDPASIRKQLKDLWQHMDKLKRISQTRQNALGSLCLELKQENEKPQERIDSLEKLLNKQPSSPNEDLLEKLFREAYLFP